MDATDLQVADTFHPLPYVELPTLDELHQALQGDEPRRREWAKAMLPLAQNGRLPTSCPHEIQLVRFYADLAAVFLGGEVLAEIGLHLKTALQPGLVSTIAYANGLIAYVPGAETYPLGGYEVDGSYHLFVRPAPFQPTVEDLIVTRTTDLAANFYD